MTTHQAWFQAASTGDLNTLTQALSDGFDINTVDDKQNTALHLATKAAQLEVMSFLIKQGAALDLQNDWLSTPLHLTEKNMDSIRLLLEAGAESNIKDKDYDYPYYFAFYGSMTQELTDLYIKHGANLIYKKDM